MNPLDRMLIFTRVTELASFTQAADTLGLPKASVSTAVQQLEAQLGTRLLHRTTRRVAPTQDGQAFYERCKDLLADVDEVQTMFQQPGAQSLRGRVRLDMSTGIARHAVIPHLPTLLQLHPLLEVELSSTERRVDLVREGFDCVLRAGPVLDTSLIARPVGHLRMVNCASPAYLQAHGTPLALADLTRPATNPNTPPHQLVHYASTLGAKPGGFDTMVDGQNLSLPMPGAITVNNADAYTAACVAGLGIIQAPAVALQSLIASGQLVQVLPGCAAPALPLHLLYANRRNLSKRVRVVMDWLTGLVQTYLQEK
jgi:DNA-binding transcriptional LysR family regulator